MEFVYVVRRHDLFERECPQGFLSLPPVALGTQFLRSIVSHGFFVERRHAEHDASLKQVIPYCVVTDGERVLRLQRQSTQGEKRLHQKLSIGIGGHINPVDGESVDGAAMSHDLGAADADVLACGALREICEELEVEHAEPIAVGVLNDDSNSVGSVHFGVVHLVRLPADVRIRETDRMAGRFAPWSELRGELARGANFESWSALILRSWAPEEFLRLAASCGEAHTDRSHSDRSAFAETVSRASSSR